MELLIRKIFFEHSDSGSGYKIRYGDLHNALTDYFVDKNIKYKPICSSLEQLIISLSLGVLAVLKTYKNNDKQEMMVDNYIRQLYTVFTICNYNKHSIFSCISVKTNDHDDKYKNIFDIKKVNQYHIADIFYNDDTYTNYDYVERIISIIFNRYTYTDDYITTLSLITFAFTNMINELDDRIELLTIFINELINLDTFSDEHNLIDNTNYRGYIEY
jgi:hypothetical protein